MKQYKKAIIIGIVVGFAVIGILFITDSFPYYENGGIRCSKTMFFVYAAIALISTMSYNERNDRDTRVLDNHFLYFCSSILVFSNFSYMIYAAFQTDMFSKTFHLFLAYASSTFISMCVGVMVGMLIYLLCLLFFRIVVPKTK